MRAATLANPRCWKCRQPAAKKGLEKLNEVQPTGIGTLDFIQPARATRPTALAK